MSGIFGHLNISDSERAFSVTIGQRVVFEAAQDYLARVNAEMNAAASVFVERTTDQFKLRYKLPGGGYLQRRASDGRYGAAKAYGSWDVAFKLEDFGAMMVGNDVDMAYMTVGELNNHVQNIVIQNINTVRWEILHRLFDNVQESFTDPIHGSLSVEPLANGDTVVYPPVVGSLTEATEDHYLASTYTAANISDTNDPYVTLVAELEHHYGKPTGGSNVVCFINDNQRAKTMDLTDIVEVPDNWVVPGDDTAVPRGLANVPGRMVARHTAGTWISVWDWIPANYILAVHLEVEAPIIRRIDPADTGLGNGLQLVAREDEFPFQEAIWRHRFGLGCGNRLGAAVMFLTSGSTYTIPTDYD